MATPREPARKVRCAIYCRKSHVDGLEQDFNSLDAQREACESYIASQKALGWVALPDLYDDGGYSGGSMDRPALRRLLVDVEAGGVDCVVLYRLDRLSRSIVDFSKIAELLEGRDVTFVSVTESFSTATPSGRLHLHMILSFAQYEREVTADRIRDKIAAAKRRGKHTGGMPVLGYDTDRERKCLVVNPEEARLVCRIFRRFLELGSMTRLADELNEKGHTTKEWVTKSGRVAGGTRWNKSHLYRLLHNPKYLGKVEHKGTLYEGEHDGIVSQELWDEVHAVLEANHRARGNTSRAETPALLKGIIRCGCCGCAMGPTFTKKGERRYRYYLCVQASKRGAKTCPVRRVSAGEIEGAVLDQLRAVFQAPELVSQTFREARAREAGELERLRAVVADGEAHVADLTARAERLLEATGEKASGAATELRLTSRDIDQAKERVDAGREQIRALETHAITEAEVSDALRRLDPIWEELFPAEQARIVRLLVERVDVEPEGIELRLRVDGLRSLAGELDRKEAS